MKRFSAIMQPAALPPRKMSPSNAIHSPRRTGPCRLISFLPLSANQRTANSTSSTIIPSGAGFHPEPSVEEEHINIISRFVPPSHSRLLSRMDLRRPSLSPLLLRKSGSPFPPLLRNVRMLRWKKSPANNSAPSSVKRGMPGWKSWTKSA